MLVNWTTVICRCLNLIIKMHSWSPSFLSHHCLSPSTAMQLERDPIHHVFPLVPSGHLLYRLFLRNNHELLTNYRLHLHDHLVPSWWRCHRIRFALFESECKPNPVHSFCIISIWHRSWTLQSRRTKDLNSIVNAKEFLHARRFDWINYWSPSSWNRFNVPL